MNDCIIKRTVSLPCLLLHRQANPCMEAKEALQLNTSVQRRLQVGHFHERTQGGSFCCLGANCPA
jgi:hypothetical protein